MPKTRHAENGSASGGLHEGVTEEDGAAGGSHDLDEVFGVCEQGGALDFCGVDGGLDESYHK